MKVKIEIFNQLGQLVAFNNLGVKPAGTFAYHFYSEDLPSGLYFYRLRAGDVVKTKKMIMAR